MKLEIKEGNAWDKLLELEDNSIGSLVTDPPYLINFLGNDWDKLEDNIAGNKDFWKLVLSKLKPGAHGLVFGHSRTHHRVMIALEDAGFEIRDTMMWLYGSGFPKNHDISKAIDKNGGNVLLADEISKQLKQARTKRKITLSEADKMFCNGSTNYSWYEGRKAGNRIPSDSDFKKICDEWEELQPLAELVKEANREVIGTYQGDMGGLGGKRLGNKGGEITISSTDNAKKWEGWGTALKPAYEPIILVRKPLAKGRTVAQNCLEHNVGGINIDGSRIGMETIVSHHAPKGTFAGGEPDRGSSKDYYEATGRYPANVILSHHPDCVLVGEQKEEYNINKLDGGASHFGQQIKPDYTPETQSITNEIWDCDDNCPAKIMDVQSGITKSSKGSFKATDYEERETATPFTRGDFQGKGDKGGASRFFKQVGCVDDCPVHILDEQAPEVGSLFSATRTKATSGGSGDSWTNGGKKAGEDNGLNDGLGGASRFFYNAKVAKKERTIAGNNSHPTVKPVSLMYYLVNLITPEGETCLDPFMGSGATGMACALLDRDFIGIEMDATFAATSRERIEYARDNKQKTIKICKVKENSNE